MLSFIIFDSQVDVAAQVTTVNNMESGILVIHNSVNTSMSSSGGYTHNNANASTFNTPHPHVVIGITSQ